MLVPILALLLNINQAEEDEDFDKAKAMNVELLRLIKEQLGSGTKAEDLTELLHAAGWDDWRVDDAGNFVEIQ